MFSVLQYKVSVPDDRYAGGGGEAQSLGGTKSSFECGTI